MVFLGPIIQAVKGGVEKINNESKITDLEKEIERDLFEDFTEEEKLVAQLKLKQADLELAVLNKRSQQYVSIIEKELTALMERNIKLKMEKLKQKEATQLDIANTMIAIQKMSHDLKNNLDIYKKELNNIIKTFSEKISGVEDFNKLYLDRTTEQKKINQQLMQKQIENREDLNTLKNSIQLLEQSISDIHEKQNLLNNMQKYLQNEIQGQRNKIYHMENNISDIIENIKVNEEKLIDLTETAQFQRWVNRSVLILSFTGLIMGLINYL